MGGVNVGSRLRMGGVSLRRMYLQLIVVMSVHQLSVVIGGNGLAS